MARSQGNAGPTGRLTDPVSGLLFRILDFLDAKFKNLSPRMRAVAYFALLALFCATTWRLAAGQYVVHGVIWNGDEYATMCEVRLRSDFFSTNSKGMFYAVLTPSQYYRFVAASEVELPIACRMEDGQMKRLPGPYPARLSWWDDELSEIFLEAPKVTKVSAAPAPLSLFSTPAYAQPDPQPQPSAQRPPVGLLSEAPPTPALLPSKGDRLVVDWVELGGSAREMRRVEFEIDLGTEEKPLLLEGAEAGKLPMKPKVAFGESYYFDVAPLLQGRRVSIEMEATGLFGPEEEFEFRMPKQYNVPLPVKGSRGSTLHLRLAPRAADRVEAADRVNRTLEDGSPR